MSFNTLDFMLLFGVTFCLYYVLPKKLRNPLLLVSSYVFYAAYNTGLTLYLAAVTLFSYAVALMAGAARQRGSAPAARRWMILGVAVNLGVLAFYKYFNFAAEILAGVLGTQAAAASRLVPFGISFISFTSVSYIVDVQRGKYAAEKNLLKYALFTAFFPKIGQGPIARADEVLPQFDEEHTFDIKRYREGMLMVLYGLFMKMVVADTASLVIDPIYANPGAHSGAEVLMATLFFALQLYCDFAGYSYTAIGAAKTLGFDLKANFRQPYMSRSVGEFWRRWHISLNNWLRDYIYIPLGGSRCSKGRKNLNVLATFTFSGLWHGADWGYMAWGFLNGLYVIGESHVKDLLPDRKDGQAAPSAFVRVLKNLVSRFVTVALVTFAWIFFRARKLPAAFTAISRIFTAFDLTGFVSNVADKLSAGSGSTLYGLNIHYTLPALLISTVVVIVMDILSDKRDCFKALADGPRAVRWAVCYLLIFAMLIFGVYGYGYSASSFIYAAF